MKGWLVAMCLLFCLPVLHAQKTRYGQQPPYAKPGVDYPIKVHVTAMRIQYEYESTRYEVIDSPYAEELHANAIINQKKLELTCGFLYDPHYYQPSFLPGDYAARLLKPSKGAAAPIFDEYELLLPDRHIWRCTVTGISE